MTGFNPALLPDPPLFDVTDIAKKGVEGSIERFGLDELELAPNARREISACDCVDDDSAMFMIGSELGSMRCRTGSRISVGSL